jgi:hypothetical protein
MQQHTRHTCYYTCHAQIAQFITRVHTARSVLQLHRTSRYRLPYAP